jgi:two-component system chemotaxis sensor kinase CheA
MELDRAALLATFRQEADELLSEIERLALDLDDAPGEVGIVEELFRLAHTLKGGASCVGFERVMALAHELEALFDAVTTGKRNSDRELAALTLAAVDLLRRGMQVAEACAAEPISGELELVGALRAWLERQRPGLPKVVAASSPGSVPEARHSLRVDVERLDALLNLVGEVAIAQGRLRASRAARGDLDDDPAWQAFDTLFQGLEQNVMRLRLVPLAPTFERFRRAVRDLSERAGKLAELVTEGGDVEVDVTLAEALRDPLMHMIRNAVDHGLESPERRKACGKDVVGRIVLRARHDGNYVVVEIADDGAGLDTERLRERAATLGFATAGGDDGALSELCFAPGLSTAAEVTELSGRGIGMDVVRRDIEAMRGSVTLVNAPGRGVTVSLRVPLTVAVIQGFGVTVDTETYILPVDAIAEVMDLDRERAIVSEGGGLLELRGEALPFLDLAQRFAVRRSASARQAIVVLEHGTERAGLGVDALIGEVQTVIKPLGPLFSAVEHVAGSAVMADGRVALVLDVGSLLRSAA